MPLAPGDQLGPYEILSRIGAGGMGEVWKARDTRLNHLVAIKQIKAEHNARSQQDARAIAALNHPAICQIYDIGPDYLVLEYIEGRPLRGPLAPAEALAIALPIAQALQTAHAKGILHRDLKPGNILLTASGPKLLDFGLAKLLDEADATQTIGVAGTPLYMSPEQASGKPLDSRSDVFSFGAVFYELLAGKRAFDSLAAVVRDQPAKLPLSIELDTIVTRCLAKEPSQRFHSEELRLAIERALTQPASDAAQGPIDSIAVLPFANQAQDPDADYLCEGVAENLMNSLAQLTHLRVAPRGTVFRYKASDADPHTIGRELGVRAVLTGRISQRAGNILVATELVDVAAGSQLWGERFHRPLADLFALEEEIAQKISESLRAKLGGAHPPASAKPAKRYSANAEAYQLVLRARHHWTRRTPEHIKRSAELFQMAIDKDPSYALAYSGLADCCSLLGTYFLLPAKETLARAKAAAVAALAFDPDLPEAHNSLAFIRAYLDMDWAGAESEFQRSIELNPAHWGSRYWYAMMLTSTGRYGEAEVQIARSLELEPLSSVALHGAMMLSNFQGRFDLTIERGLRGIETDPHHFLLRQWLACAYSMTGRHDEAIRQQKKSVELSEGGISWAVGLLGFVYAAAGDRPAAERILAQLLDWEHRAPMEPTSLASVYMGLGDHAQALHWLERATEVKGLAAVTILGDPILKPLHPDPRFQAVLRKMNLA